MKKLFTVLLVMLFAISQLIAQAPSIVLVTPDDRDDAQYEFLIRNGFDVTKYYPEGNSIAAVSQDEIDMLNAADLVIVGRAAASPDFDGDDKPVWNAITAPMIYNSQWIARSNRVNMIKSSSASHGNTGPAVEYGTVLLPADPIFGNVTLDGDSMAWMLPPHDYIAGADSATNGTLVVKLGSYPLVMRWDADTEYYPGAGDTCAGPRVYFGFGNDDIGPGRGADETVNFFPLTREAKAVYLAEICRVLGIPIQEPVFGAEDVRVMVYTDYEADKDARGRADDYEQIQWLVNQGFYVTKFYAGDALSTVGQDTLDKMNLSVDVVIVGRSCNSSTFDGEDQPVWNALTVPLIVNSQWVARSNRIGMINSTSATHGNDGPPMVYANVLVPGDPIFSDVTLTGDSVGWMLTPHDYVGGADSATNGTMLASAAGMYPLIIRWDGGTEYYPGSGVIPAGPRVYFGFGNDNLRDNGVEMWPNDFPLTKAGKQVYLAQICMTGGIDAAQVPSAVFTAADAVVTFVTDYDADETDRGYFDDNPQVDWLKKNNVHVNLFYPGDALSAASQDTIDMLNASELIIVGRSNNSGNFDGDDKPVWNALTAPLIINSQWVARSNRIGMINSTSATHGNDGPPMVYAMATMPDDDIFSNVTLTGDSVGWMLTPHDYVGGADSATNGTLLATAGGLYPLIITWEGGTEYYPGAGAEATPAGPRAFFGFGNDNLRDNGVNYRPNDFPLTTAGQQVYLNVIAKMVGAELSEVETISSDAMLDSLTIDAGTMTPEFDSDTMAYTIQLGEGETAVTLAAYPSGVNAMTIGDSAVEVTDTMVVNVHVMAENWNELIYKVTIYPAGTPEGIADLEASAAQVKLYPNPVQDMLYMESDVLIERVTVFNVVGKVVIDQTGLRSERIQLNVGNLKPGLYMIKVEGDGMSTMTKMLKR